MDPLPLCHHRASLSERRPPLLPGLGLRRFEVSNARTQAGQPASAHEAALTGWLSWPPWADAKAPEHSISPRAGCHPEFHGNDRLICAGRPHALSSHPARALVLCMHPYSGTRGNNWEPGGKNFLASSHQALALVSERLAANPHPLPRRSEVPESLSHGRLLHSARLPPGKRLVPRTDTNPRRSPTRAAKSTDITMLHGRYIHRAAPSAALGGTPEGDDGSGVRLCIREILGPLRPTQPGRKVEDPPTSSTDHDRPTDRPIDRSCRALRPSRTRVSMMIYYITECALWADSPIGERSLYVPRELRVRGWCLMSGWGSRVGRLSGLTSRHLDDGTRVPPCPATALATKTQQ